VYRGATRWIYNYWRRRIGRPPIDGEIEPQTRAYFDHTLGVSAADYLSGVELLQRISRKVADWFEDYDVCITPTLGAARRRWAS
jgi:amidase